MTTDASEATVTPEDTPIQRPRTIDIAAAATVGRAIAWLASAFTIDPNRDALVRLAQKAAEKSKTPTKPLEVVTTHDALKLAIPLALILLVLAKFLRDGKTWAKWLVVITAMPLLATGDVLKVLNVFGPLPVGIKIAYVAVGLTTLVSIVCIFRSDATEYFRAVSPPMSLFRTSANPVVPGAEEVGDTDVSTAIRRKPPRAKSRKAPEEKK